MYKLKLEIDPELLKKQLADMAELSDHFWPEPGSPRNSIEGIISLLGSIRDQIEPVREKSCCECINGSRLAPSSDGFQRWRECSCECHATERRKQNRTLYTADGTIAGYMLEGYCVYKDRRSANP